MAMKNMYDRLKSSPKPSSRFCQCLVKKHIEEEDDKQKTNEENISTINGSENGNHFNIHVEVGMKCQGNCSLEGCEVMRNEDHPLEVKDDSFLECSGSKSGRNMRKGFHRKTPMVTWDNNFTDFRRRVKKDFGNHNIDKQQFIEVWRQVNGQMVEEWDEKEGNIEDYKYQDDELPPVELDDVDDDDDIVEESAHVSTYRDWLEQRIRYKSFWLTLSTLSYCNGVFYPLFQIKLIRVIKHILMFVEWSLLSIISD